jgi:hypothetical protein
MAICRRCNQPFTCEHRTKRPYYCDGCGNTTEREQWRERAALRRRHNGVPERVRHPQPAPQRPLIRYAGWDPTERAL